MNSMTQQGTESRSAAPGTAQLVGYFQLLRPANLVTSGADVVTGWVIVGAPIHTLVWPLLASVGMYGGGVVLNDFFDRHLDAVERPERPIPSGLITAWSAASLGAVLIAAALVCGFLSSTLTGFLCVAIAVAVLAYDGGLKHHAAGPLLMGSCRGLNLLLGLSAAPALLGSLWFLSLISFAYVCGITLLSRGEVHGGERRESIFAMALISLAVLALLALSSTSGQHLLTVVPFVALWMLKAGLPLWRAVRVPRAAEIRTAVHAGVVSLIVLDASLAASYAGLVRGAAILSLSVLAGELARLFAVT